MSKVKKLTFTAICIALCVALPRLFHAVGLGTAFSPMHFPALLCGLLCGPVYGLVCGLIGPVLASLITGAPPVTMLLSMAPELMAYGLAAGLAFHFIHTGKTLADIVITLLIAMVFGRIIGIIAKVIVTLILGGTALTAGGLATSYFVSTLPGVAAQIILIPVVYLALMKARLVPQRYPKKA